MGKVDIFRHLFQYHRALQNLAESVQKTQKRLEDLTDETNRVLRTLYSGVLDEVDVGYLFYTFLYNNICRNISWTITKWSSVN